jgi:hypothetical protein
MANMISTEKILFILGGSFERPQDNLESIVKKRLAHKGNIRDEDGGIVIRGFAPAIEEGDKKQFKNYYKEANADYLIRFVLIPELVGRSPIRTFVNLLSKNDLIRIMNDTEDSLMDQYKMEFDFFGIDLEIMPEAIDYVAEISENSRTGARALVSVWENILTDFQFELPGSNFAELNVTRELCERPKDALLAMMERSPFVDFLERFRREYGLDLVLDKEAEQYIEEYAAHENIQISEAVNRLLKGASALNYMGISGPFTITREILETPGYFDNVFTEWHKRRVKEEDEW